jgi:outer membrane receptor for monomeric catechols
MDNSMKLATLGTQDKDVDKQRKKDNTNIRIEHRFHEEIVTDNTTQN